MQEKHRKAYKKLNYDDLSLPADRLPDELSVKSSIEWSYLALVVSFAQTDHVVAHENWVKTIDALISS